MANPDRKPFLSNHDWANIDATITNIDTAIADRDARDRDARDRAASKRAHPTFTRPNAVNSKVIERIDTAIADRAARDAGAAVSRRPTSYFVDVREAVNKRAGEIDARSKYIAQRDRMRQLPVRIPGPARGRKG